MNNRANEAQLLAFESRRIITTCCWHWTVKDGAVLLGKWFIAVCILSLILLPLVWEVGVLGLCLTLGPSIAFGFVLKDDSSVNRRFFYRAFKISVLAFSICLTVGLITLSGTLTQFCTNQVKKQEGSSQWSQDRFDYAEGVCEGRIRIAFIFGGFVVLLASCHFMLVLKQNYINRLPLSQAIVASQRGSFRSSLSSRNVDELTAVFSVNLPPNVPQI
jgi:hypothetical protein